MLTVGVNQHSLNQARLIAIKFDSLLIMFLHFIVAGEKLLDSIYIPKHNTLQLLVHARCGPKMVTVLINNHIYYISFNFFPTVMEQNWSC